MSQLINMDAPNFYAKILQTIGMSFAESIATVAGRVYLSPLIVNVDVTISAIAVQWGGTVAGNARVGIYRDNGNTPVGGALVVQSASIAKNGSYRGQEFPVANTKLTKGLYWLALESDEGTTLYYRNGTDWFTAGQTFSAAGYYDHGYGVLTDPCPAVTASTTTIPFGYVLVYSVP